MAVPKFLYKYDHKFMDFYQFSWTHQIVKVENLNKIFTIEKKIHKNEVLGSFRDCECYRWLFRGKHFNKIMQSSLKHEFEYLVGFPLGHVER